MRKGSVSPTRLALSEAAVRALTLALMQAGRQVTYRQVAAAWDQANTGAGVPLPKRHSWTTIFEPAVRDGRVVVTRPGFLPFYTLRDGPEYPLPAAGSVSFTSYRLEISAAAERALALALARAGRQVVWSELQEAWCEANHTSERPFLRDTKAGYVTEPARIAGRMIQTRDQGFTFYTLAEGPVYTIPCFRPQFTEERLQGASAAEKALELALGRAGHQVTWREMHAAWEEANGYPCRYNGVSNWRWILEPSIQGGRVIKTRREATIRTRGGAKARRRAFVYYTLVDRPDYLLPPEPEFSEFRLAKCEAAKRALALALSRAGTQVQREAVCAAWMEANSSNSLEVREPPASGTHWNWTIAPAVGAGQIVVTRRAGQAYYTVASGPAYALPPRLRGPRVFGPRLRARMEKAERALALAAGEANEMVETPDIVAAWLRANAELPDCDSSGVLEILRASAKLGRTRHWHQNRHNYFAPSDRPDLAPPAFASDLHRIEEAIRRAVARMRSAVLFEEVVCEVESDPELRPRGDVTVAGVLGTLQQWSRIRAFNHLGRRAGYFYYAPLDGPTWVRAEAEHHLDRRYRAVLGLWRASHGRPFTTRAIRRFASSRPGLQITRDPPYGWTNALKLFCENGDLAAIHDGNDHFLRWAPAEEWTGLSAEERKLRLRDPFGRDVDPDEPLVAGATGLDEDATPHDVAHASRARDLRTIVLVAKAIRGAPETDPERRRVLRARPVTLVEMREALHARPALRIGDAELLAAHLSEAVRIRECTRRPALASLGVVGRQRFVDVRETAAGQAYVGYRIAAEQVKLKNARYRVRLLRHACDLSDLQLVPLPRAILDARAHQLAIELRARARSLVSACRRAELLKEEHRQALAEIRELRSLTRDAVRLASKPGHAAQHDTVERAGLPSAAATEQVSAFFPGRLPHDSAILYRLGSTAHLPADSETKRLQKVQKRRSVKWMVDRVGFACHSAIRWGGPSLASLGQQAWHAMGDLRAPDLFIGALRDSGATSAHAASAAVLGFFDDGPSRRALVDYIRASFAEPGHVTPGTSLVAVETAVFGLAPLPFGACATTLLDDERTILQQVVRDGADERIRAVAARVLRAWEGGWTRDRLLFL